MSPEKFATQLTILNHCWSITRETNFLQRHVQYGLLPDFYEHRWQTLVPNLVPLKKGFVVLRATWNKELFEADTNRKKKVEK